MRRSVLIVFLKIIFLKALEDERNLTNDLFFFYKASGVRVSEKAYSLFSQPSVQCVEYFCLCWMSNCSSARYLRHIIQIAAFIVLNGRLFGLAPTGIISTLFFIIIIYTFFILVISSF